MSDVTSVRTWTKEVETTDKGRYKVIPPKTEVFEIDGPMFFATSDKISGIEIANETKVIIIRMRNIPSLDVSALHTLTEVYEYCKKSGIIVIFSHANDQPLEVMKKAGFYDMVGDKYFVGNIDEALSLAENLSEN